MSRVIKFGSWSLSYFVFQFPEAKKISNSFGSRFGSRLVRSDLEMESVMAPSQQTFSDSLAARGEERAFIPDFRLKFFFKVKEIWLYLFHTNNIII